MKSYSLFIKLSSIRFIIVILLLGISVQIFAEEQKQRFSVRGEVIDKQTRKPIQFVAVSIWKGTQFSTTDSLGRFNISNVAAGAYRIQADLLGFNQYLSPEIMVSRSGEYLVIEMEEQARSLSQIIVRPQADPFRRVPESPLSQRSIGIQEIEKNPGSNRDISRVINSLPGVASVTGSGYRNDILVRGGGPSENRFFLDGIEIPTINHFSTQGASGGPVGIIDADLIREVDFYAGSFPVNKANALSSVMDIKLKDGDPLSNKYKITVGASEAGFSSNGHITDKTNYLFSARTSYLQFLFKALELPFLPTFSDIQFKVKTRFDSRHELTIIGIAGIDNMKLNKDAGGTEDRDYILSYLPVIQQEVFTLGAAYKYYYGKSNLGLYLSHSYLNNRNTKYLNNDETSDANLTLKYKSVEQETKFRIENISRIDRFRITAGMGAEGPFYTNNTFQKIYTINPVTVNYQTDLSFLKYSFFVSGSYTSADESFTAALSLRTDAATFSDNLSNPLEQLSPRFSLSYRFAKDMYLNAGIGRYYQLPPFTALGFKNQAGDYANKSLKYMGSDHFTLGLEYKPSANLQITLEGFYKRYFNGLSSVKDTIPVAGKGVDFGFVGNEELKSDVNGRSYGVELSTRVFVSDKFNLIGSLTLFKSEFESLKDGKWTPQSWDNRRLLTLAGNYKLPANFNIGVKYRYSGGSPYTPYDELKSSLVTAWDVRGRAYLDYNKYNSEYQPIFSQLDFRLDKDFYFEKFALKLYLDIQNITNSKYKNPDAIVSTGRIINPTAPLNQQRYEMKRIELNDGTLLPTIGITLEF